MKSPTEPPLPEQITAIRRAVGLTKVDAANMVHASVRAWHFWESGERRMHPAFWELFRIKAARK